MTETINTIKSLLKTISDVSDQRIVKWRSDPRSGVQLALKSWDNQQQKTLKKEQAFQERFSFERQHWQEGLVNIAGVDEVGRGPLAGPVIAAAVILPHDFHSIEVIDSKQLSAKKRNELYYLIIEQAISIGVGIVEAPQIDEINIYQAARVAMTQAVQELAPTAEFLLIDAMSLDLSTPQASLIKGDARSNSIAAASIVAKVTRDKLMTDYDTIYPGYGFANNAGYGTQEHLEGIQKLGITPIHRRSFGPVHERI